MSVFQGTCLGPILFLCFINDLPNATDLLTVLFADDTTGLDSDSDLPSLITRVQNELTKLSHWFIANKMSLNVRYLTIRQYYWRTDAPCANIMADRTRKKKSAKHSLNIIGAQCLVNIAYWRRGTSVRQYPHRLTVRCASPIFIPIAY
jgi:hypothetical protein